MLRDVGALALSVAPHLHVFQENGLDRSLHAPVLIGLCVLTLFAETLGWTYAGLVVPGYLATVFVAAPLTGALVVGEAVLTYVLTAFVGLWLPRTGVWSSSFGRERFFLFIVGAVLVRLAVEGSFLPWLSMRTHFTHSRELYSIGLVLVPLVANSLWNAGFLTAAPRIAIVTAITFVFVRYGLLVFTNFTVSRFTIANEALSQSFLESPHAYIILVIGALLGARNNLLYGWDYNGILVPALLAVAWYQPTKLATTTIEAILVYQVALYLSERPPLKRFLIVGSRRMVLVFLVGFALKYALGAVVGHFAPRVQMVDYFGFGYLLPSLLAVKMWNKQKIGTVVMPTLQVSLMGFLLGNAVGFGLTVLDERLASAHPALESVSASRSAAMDLMLGDSAPSPRSPSLGAGEPEPWLLSLRVAHELTKGRLDQSAVDDLQRASLIARHDATHLDWFTLVPRADDPEDDRVGPRVAFRAGGRGAPWLVIAMAESTDSPASAVAMGAAEFLDARAVVVASRSNDVARQDFAFAEKLGKELGTERTLVITTTAARGALSVVGAVPERLDVVGLGRWIGTEFGIDFRGASANGRRFSDSPRLEIPKDVAGAFGARVLGASPSARWSGGFRRELEARMRDLTRVGPSGYDAPSVEELRIFSSVLWPALLQLSTGGEPSPWQCAVGQRLGYQFVGVGDGPESWALVEPQGPARRGNATVAVRRRPAGVATEKIAIEIPGAVWERGSFDVGLALHAALDADLLLAPGALPIAGETDVRKRTGRRSFYDRAHEEWLATGGRVIAVRALGADKGVPEDAVVSYGRETAAAALGPSWSSPLVRLLANAGLRVGAFDGALVHAALEGSTDPTFDYARKFADDQMLLLWVSESVRDRWARLERDTVTEARLRRAGANLIDADVAERAFGLVSCETASPPAPELVEACRAVRAAGVCDIDAGAAAFSAYTETANPFELRAALEKHVGCYVEVIHDAKDGREWALVTGASKGRLVLLRVHAAAATTTLRTPSELRHAVALGFSNLDFGRE